VHTQTIPLPIQGFCYNCMHCMLIQFLGNYWPFDKVLRSLLQHSCSLSQEWLLYAVHDVIRTCDLHHYLHTQPVSRCWSGRNIKQYFTLNRIIQSILAREYSQAPDPMFLVWKVSWKILVVNVEGWQCLFDNHISIATKRVVWAKSPWSVSGWE
jgi:hypothetical protein